MARKIFILRKICRDLKKTNKKRKKDYKFINALAWQELTVQSDGPVNGARMRSEMLVHFPCRRIEERILRVHPNVFALLTVVSYK